MRFPNLTLCSHRTRALRLRWTRYKVVGRISPLIYIISRPVLFRLMPAVSHPQNGCQTRFFHSLAVTRHSIPLFLVRPSSVGLLQAECNGTLVGSCLEPLLFLRPEDLFRFYVNA